jgi:hypothetical protein
MTECIVRDYIVLGAGISGCYVANKLISDIPNSSVLIIDKNKEIGGVWYQTKWSWLCSDSPAMGYCPSEYLTYILSKYKCFYDGTKVEDLNKIMKEQTKHIEKKMDTIVHSIFFSSIEKFWKINTNNGVFKCKFIINCTGMFQTQNIPIELSDYFEKNNIKFCHSSNFNDLEIKKDLKIAVIGSRESGLQIVKGLSNTHKIDWYARSFNNFYMDISNETGFGYKLHVTMHFLIKLFNKYKLIKFVDYVSAMFRMLINFFRNFLFLFIFRFKIKSVLKLITQKERLFENLNFKNYLYNYTQPFKPVPYDGNNFNFKNITVKNLNNNLIEFKNYDLVILATGYKNYIPFEIIVDGERILPDVFYLVEKILPYRIPNLIFCVPYSTETYKTLEFFYKKIINILKKKNYFIVNDKEYDKYKNNIDAYLKFLNLTKEEWQFHSRSQYYVE